MLTTKQVAERLGVSTRTVELWRADGRGPAWVRVGGQVRYTETALAAWVGEHTVTAAVRTVA